MICKKCGTDLNPNEFPYNSETCIDCFRLNMVKTVKKFNKDYNQNPIVPLPDRKDQKPLMGWWEFQLLKMKVWGRKTTNKVLDKVEQKFDMVILEATRTLIKTISLYLVIGIAIILIVVLIKVIL